VRPGLGPELLQSKHDYRESDEGLVWIKAGEEKVSRPKLALSGKGWCLNG